ncbi:MAG: tetratricopeptide repeat protein [Nitrospirae bacterium]|nr:tetratricopeptide repeat protein [Nitrospirota bacterium]MBF0533738.1 tetratricopeptide repeat protein [Nitrospirota bacterium]MBF0615553.1 tetratricopeptide repeat protein [Nitrospirota bacterium]
MYRKNSVILFIILASAFIPYLNIFNSPFVFDDASIVNFFTIRSFKESRYITESTFTINHIIHGLWLPGYHFVNIIIHAFNGILIYLLIMQLFKIQISSITNNAAKKYSFIISLAFLLHPIQIQAVTFLSQRSTALLTFFVLSALNIYVLWRRRCFPMDGGNTIIEYSKNKSVGLYMLAMIIAVLSVKVKELAVVLPFLITLVEFTFFSGKIKSRIAYVLPFCLIIPAVIFNALGVSSVSFDSQMQTTSIPAGNMPDVVIVYDVKSPLIANTRMEYILTEFRVIVTYLRMLVLPLNLTLIHYYPVSRSFFDLKVILSLLFILTIFLFGAIMFFQGNKQKDVMKKLTSFGIFWFFIGILPQSSLINKYGWTIFEYRVYLASPGVFITLLFITLKFIRNITVIKLIFKYIIPAIIAISAVCTFYLNMNWRNEVSLWEDNVKKEPLHPIARIMLGNAYGRAKHFKEALRELNLVSQMEPGFPEIPYYIGCVYAQAEQYDKALEEFEKSIEINSTLPFPHYSKGKILVYKKMWVEAAKELKLSLKLGIQTPDIYNLLGDALNMTGDVTGAIEMYENSLKLNLNNAEMHNNLGNLYTQTGNFALADSEILTALKLNPNLYDGYNNLGVLYANTGRMTDAVKEFKRALSIKKDYITGFKNLANAYMGLKMFDEADSTLNAAIAMNPDSFVILTTIGNMHLLKGDKAMAREFYLKALKINPSYTEALKNIELTKTN